MPATLEQIAAGLARGFVTGAIEGLTQNGPAVMDFLRLCRTPVYQSAAPVSQEFADALDTQLKSAGASPAPVRAGAD